MKNITIYTTGGTIAMQHDAGTGVVKPNEGHGMEGWVGHLTNVSMVDLFNKPSPHITFEDLYTLLSNVQSSLADPDVDGVVVTHGTDTLEETAYFLDLHLPLGKPIIVTGAMKSGNELGSDGATNLINAVQTAAAPQSSGRGTLVVFQGEIHAARYVSKVHTTGLSAFKSTEHGPIGFVDKETPVYHYAPAPQAVYPSGERDGSVHLLKMALDTDDTYLDFLVERGAAGIVIEAFGAGNVPPKMLPGIKRAISAGIPVVLVSRCGSGRVQATYGYEGGGYNLKEKGVIFSNRLNGQKARIKLSVVLSYTKDYETIRNAFELEG